jgi:hypothetical protein
MGAEDPADTDNEVLIIDDVESMKEIGFTLINSDDPGELKGAFDEISMKCTDMERREKVFDAIQQSDSPRIILQSLRKHIDSQYVVAQALSTVHNSSLSKEIAHMYVMDGCFQLIIECMQKYPDNLFLQIRGCGVLGILVKMNDATTMIPLIQQHEACQMLVQAMEKHTNDPKLFRWALKGIDTITQIEELKEYFLDSGLLSSIASCIEHSRKQEANEYTTDIHTFAWASLLRLK